MTRREVKYSNITAWAKGVKERDGYACDICGKVSRSNDAHHLNDKSHFPKMKLLLSNGVTLCKLHHKGENKEGFHSWWGGTRKKCTAKDYYRFKYQQTHFVAKIMRLTIVVVFLALVWLKLDK